MDILILKEASKRTLPTQLRLGKLNNTRHGIIGVRKSPVSCSTRHLHHLKTSPQLCNVVSYIYNRNVLSNSFHFSSNKHSSQQEEDKDGKSQDKRENVMTLANILTTSRIIMTPVLGYLVVHQSYPLACGLFLVAGITDALDGFIARKFNQKTALGSVLDPLADKLMVSVLTVTLTVSQLLPVPLAVIILGRDLLLILASLYIRYISLSTPRTLARFCDVGDATMRLYPSNLSKMNTFLQITLIASSLAAPVFGFVDHVALQVLWYTTGTTTVLSGVDYYLKRDQTVRIKRKL